LTTENISNNACKYGMTLLEKSRLAGVTRAALRAFGNSHLLYMNDTNPGSLKAVKMKNKQGLTLIELLVTAVLLGIGLVGVAGMFTAGVVSSTKASNITVAAHRANLEIERVRDAGYLGAVADVAHFPSPTYTVVSSHRATFTVPELRNGSGYIDIYPDSAAQLTNPATGLPYENLKRLRIVISWGGGHHVAGNYTVVTLIANRPV
jgi:prepilin-type N-terminal cleavage/methylation domain-containing protein